MFLDSASTGWTLKEAIDKYTTDVETGNLAFVRLFIVSENHPGTQSPL